MDHSEGSFLSSRLLHDHDGCVALQQVGYKAPVPASTSLVCTASLQSMEGRKAWVLAEVLDRPGGTLYATGKALFVIPKDKMLPPSKASESAAFANGGPQGGSVPETEIEIERLSLQQQ